MSINIELTNETIDSFLAQFVDPENKMNLNRYAFVQYAKEKLVTMKDQHAIYQWLTIVLLFDTAIDYLSYEYARQKIEVILNSSNPQQVLDSNKYQEFLKKRTKIR